MCGRYSLTVDADGIAVLFGAEWESLETKKNWRSRYNIAPGQRVPVIVAGAKKDHRRLRMMKWGLVPSWAADETIGSKLSNARAETVDTKPSFKQSFLQRRCIIPADGFYEWDPAKIPHRICSSGMRPMGFGGLWDQWRLPDGDILETFCILTVPSAKSIQNIHSRMPVVLREKDFDFWLNNTDFDRAALKRLLIQEPSNSFLSYAVSKLVNSPKNDDPRCVTAASELNAEEADVLKKSEEKNQEKIDKRQLRLFL